MMLRAKPLRVLIAAGLAALALGACGRRGPLEAPPVADADKAKPTSTINESVPSEDAFATNQLGRPARTNRAITIPKRDFILDPLL
ncbi:MAG: LPS translocon maturation chaperone LptM [Bosea sp. (in: a-proteobacteria)]